MIILRNHKVRIYHYIKLTANHNGWMEFRVCNIDDFSSDATQSCLDKTLLADSTGKTRFRVDPTTYDFRFQLVLPSSLACRHCVFQVDFVYFLSKKDVFYFFQIIIELKWIYNCGNNWGTDPTTGQACIGCGPQEQFYGKLYFTFILILIIYKLLVTNLKRMCGYFN